MESIINNMFHFTPYLQHLHSLNLLAKREGFVFGTCSGINALQGAIAQFRRASAFVIASDVCNGGTVKINGGWQQRRVFTFFILKKFEDEDDRETQLDICRELRRQFISKFLHDYTTPNADINVTDSQVMFDMDEVPSNEYPDMQLNSCCGLNVSISVSEPINLCYNEEEWEQPTNV